MGEQSVTINIPAKTVDKKASRQDEYLLFVCKLWGDLVITLPYLQQLKRMLPANSKLDLLTREEVEAIPKNIDLFDHIYSIRGGKKPQETNPLYILVITETIIATI